MSPRLVLHVLPPSHPCAAVEAALRLKGLDYERVVLQAGEHNDEMQRSLYPVELGERVAEVARWGDGELQDLGRRLPWGALHFRPEAMATYGGAGPLDPAGTDFAIRYVRASWRYHGISAARLATDLAQLPALLDRVDALVADGVIGGDQPTAADLQIGATVRVLLTVGDLRPLIEGRPAERVARTWFPDRQGDVPAGAFPAGWVPA